MRTSVCVSVMLRPSYFFSDLHRGLRASCETFAEKPNDAQSSLSVIKKEASAFLVGDTLGKQSLRRSPTPTGFAEFVRDVIPTGKRSGLQTRIATTEGALLCTPRKSSARFWNGILRFAKIVLTLSVAVCQSRARAKSVGRLHAELHLTLFPQGKSVSARLAHTTKIQLRRHQTS